MSTTRIRPSRPLGAAFLMGGLLGLVALTGCRGADIPVIANVTVEPDGWTASAESVQITLGADVTGIDNPIESVKVEGMGMQFDLSLSGDIGGGGEHWSASETLDGPFEVGNYEFIFTLSDTEGDTATSEDGGANVTVSAD